MENEELPNYDSFESTDACRLAITIVDMALVGYKEGLLGIEDKIKELPRGLLRTALELVVDGSDPKCINDLIDPVLEIYTNRPVEYLETQLIKYGINLLHKGFSGSEILFRLSAVFKPSTSFLTAEKIRSLLC